MPPGIHADDLALLAEIRSCFGGEYGDRRQEIIVIGMDQAVIRAALDSCLLTEDEMAQDTTQVRRFDDPFSEWLLEGDSVAS